MIKKSKRGLLSVILAMTLIFTMNLSVLAATPAIPAGHTVNGLTITRAATDLWVDDAITRNDFIVKVTTAEDSGVDFVLAADEGTLTSDPKVVSGTNTVSYTYNGVSNSCTFTGQEVTSLTVTYTGDPVTVGENVDTSKLTIKANYIKEDGSTVTDFAPTDWVVDGTTGKVMTISGAGDNNFTIRWHNKTATVTIQGKPVQTEPDPAVATLTVKYADESVLVNSNFDKNKVTVIWADSVISKTLTYDALDVKPTSTRITSIGDNNFTVGYKGKTATLVVHGYKVEKITASYTGDRVKVGSSLNKDNLKVRIYYTDNKQGLPNPDLLPKDAYTVTPATALSSGTTKFTITYSDASADYTADVSVESYGQSDLTVQSLEAKYKDASILVGNDFNTSDVTITAKYNDGSTEKIGWSKLDTKPDSIQVSKTGWNSYEIGYGGATATLQVHGYEAKGIAVEYSGGDLKVGSTIDKSNVKVKVTYTKNYKDEASSEEVSDYTMSPETVAAVGANTITVTVGEKTATFTVTGLDPNATPSPSANKTQPVTANGNKVVAKTGDDSNTWLYFVVIAVILSAGLAGTYLYKKKFSE